jgi:arsenite/tail-anchored protein-transporting ATPase
MELSPSLQGLIEERSLRWIFVGGKGGVGKTTTAASLGVLLSKHRESILIISTDPAHNLSDAFDQKLGSTPTVINGIPNLFGMEIKPNINADNIDFPDIFGIAPDENAKSLIGDIVNSIPGIDEAVSFSEMIKNVQNMPFSLIIFDTAPTGHTLRLLNFPSILDKGLSKVVALKQNLGVFINQVSGMLGRGGAEAIYNNIFDKMEQMKVLIEEINRQFKDPKVTTFVAVCIPEFLSMYETDRLVIELTKFEINIEHIVVNQVLFPEDECRMCLARQKMQTKYLSQIKDMFDTFHIVVTPLLDDEVRGVQKLTVYSRFLVEPIG